MEYNLNDTNTVCDKEIRLYFNRDVRYFPDNQSRSSDINDTKVVTHLIAKQNLCFTYSDIIAMDNDNFLKDANLEKIYFLYRHGNTGRFTNGNIANIVFIDSPDQEGKLLDIEIKLVLESCKLNSEPEYKAIFTTFTIPKEWQDLYDRNVKICDNLARNNEISLEEFARFDSKIGDNGVIEWVTHEYLSDEYITHEYQSNEYYNNMLSTFIDGEEL